MRGIKDPTAWRLPAKLIENTVRDLCIKHLGDFFQISRAFRIEDVSEIRNLQNKLQGLTTFIQTQTPETNHEIAELINKVTLFKQEIHIELCAAALAQRLHVQSTQIDIQALIFTQSIVLKKTWD